MQCIASSAPAACHFCHAGVIRKFFILSIKLGEQRLCSNGYLSKEYVCDFILLSCFESILIMCYLRSNHISLYYYEYCHAFVHLFILMHEVLR